MYAPLIQDCNMIYNKGLRPSPLLEFAQSEASDLHVQLLPRIQSPSICCTNVWFSRMFYIPFYVFVYCLKFKVLSQCRLMLFPASLWCSAFYFVAWSFVLNMICFVWSLLPRCCNEFFPCATGATWPATALDRESSTNRRFRVQCTVNLRQRCMLWPPSSWANLFMLVS